MEERAALVLKADQSMRDQAQAGLKGDQVKETIVKKFLHELIEKERQATLALFELIKNQPGY